MLVAFMIAGDLYYINETGRKRKMLRQQTMMFEDIWNVWQLSVSTRYVRISMNFHDILKCVNTIKASKTPK